MRISRLAPLAVATAVLAAALAGAPAAVSKKPRTKRCASMDVHFTIKDMKVRNTSCTTGRNVARALSSGRNISRCFAKSSKKTVHCTAVVGHRTFKCTGGPDNAAKKTSFSCKAGKATAKWHWAPISG